VAWSRRHPAGPMGSHDRTPVNAVVSASPPPTWQSVRARGCNRLAADQAAEDGNAVRVGYRPAACPSWLRQRLMPATTAAPRAALSAAPRRWFGTTPGRRREHAAEQHRRKGEPLAGVVTPALWAFQRESGFPLLDARAHLEDFATFLATIVVHGHATSPQHLCSPGQALPSATWPPTSSAIMTIFPRPMLVTTPPRNTGARCGRHRLVGRQQLAEAIRLE